MVKIIIILIQLSQPTAYNFDLSFTKEDNVIYKQNALGTLDRYYLVVINEEDEINVRYNDLINIKESKPLYYNDKDGSYIYDYSSVSTTKYKIFDKYSNYCIYQKNGNYFNLIETCNTQGRKTFYSWDTNRLVEVTNNDYNSFIINMVLYETHRNHEVLYKHLPKLLELDLKNVEE